MSQTRLYFIAKRPASTEIFTKLEIEFEDDGFPLANIEIDEAEGTDEISVYVETEDAAAISERIVRIAGSGYEIQTEELPDIDWVTKSLEGLQPVRAGGFLVHGSHDRDALEEGDIAIEIEAGLAFGTGHHGTTAGCLEMIAHVVEREAPRNALDLGTGSAVLAIALAKLVPIPVLATDIDPIAVDVAAQNAELNGVAEFVETVTAEGFENPVFAERGPFDLIIANILANPLIELAPHMAANLAQDGSIILSGILEQQHDAVVHAYVQQQLQHVETLHREGWVTIYLKR